jgi:hypothetical protein
MSFITEKKTAVYSNLQDKIVNNRKKTKQTKNKQKKQQQQQKKRSGKTLH